MEHAPRARSVTTIAASAIGLVLAGLTLFSAFTLLTENTELFREDIQNAIDTVTGNETARLDRDAIDTEADTLTLMVRVAGGSQLLVGLALAGFSALLLSLKGGGRKGLLVLGFLGLVGSSVLYLTLGQTGLIAGFAGSVLLILLTLAPTTRRDFAGVIGDSAALPGAEGTANAWIIGPDGHPLDEGWVGESSRNSMATAVASTATETGAVASAETVAMDGSVADVAEPTFTDEVTASKTLIPETNAAVMADPEAETPKKKRSKKERSKKESKTSMVGRLRKKAADTTVEEEPEVAAVEDVESIEDRLGSLGLPEPQPESQPEPDADSMLTPSRPAAMQPALSPDLGSDLAGLPVASPTAHTDGRFSDTSTDSSTDTPGDPFGATGTPVAETLADAAQRTPAVAGANAADLDSSPPPPSASAVPLSVDPPAAPVGENPVAESFSSPVGEFDTGFSDDEEDWWTNLEGTPATPASPAVPANPAVPASSPALSDELTSSDFGAAGVEPATPSEPFVTADPPALIAEPTLSVPEPEPVAEVAPEPAVLAPEPAVLAPEPQPEPVAEVAPEPEQVPVFEPEPVAAVAPVEPKPRPNWENAPSEPVSASVPADAGELVAEQTVGAASGASVSGDGAPSSTGSAAGGTGTEGAAMAAEDLYSALLARPVPEPATEEISSEFDPTVGRSLRQMAQPDDDDGLSARFEKLAPPMDHLPATTEPPTWETAPATSATEERREEPGDTKTAPPVSDEEDESNWWAGGGYLS
jgi:hypothetical protein